jgi:hypothetical protein
MPLGRDYLELSTTVIPGRRKVRRGGDGSCNVEGGAGVAVPVLLCGMHEQRREGWPAEKVRPHGEPLHGPALLLTLTGTCPSGTSAPLWT